MQELACVLGMCGVYVLDHSPVTTKHTHVFLCQTYGLGLPLGSVSLCMQLRVHERTLPSNPGIPGICGQPDCDVGSLYLHLCT